MQAVNILQAAHFWIAVTQLVFGIFLFTIKISNSPIKDKIKWWIVILPFTLSFFFFFVCFIEQLSKDMQ